jgi:hypothetical protein
MSQYPSDPDTFRRLDFEPSAKLCPWLLGLDALDGSAALPAFRVSICDGVRLPYVSAPFCRHLSWKEASKASRASKSHSRGHNFADALRTPLDRASAAVRAMLRIHVGLGLTPRLCVTP